VLLRADPPLHLTYCTNIHAAHGWPAIDATLRRITPALKARFSPEAPFGLGLRLGARDARELLQDDRLERFRSFLADQGLYVALINGFPYGPFHGEPVKTHVYAPDWRSDARVDYTYDLIRILSALLPDGVAGGISTTPLSYKAWMPAPAGEDWERLTRNIVRVAERLVEVRRQTGRCLHLDIEPEPDCLLETSGEAVEYFQRWLQPIGGAELARRLGIDSKEAREHLREHIQLCFDVCHCGVEYEDPAAALARLRDAGIRIGRVQLSSALNVHLPADPAETASVEARLEPFADSTYLHQVIEKQGADLRRFPDLEDALHSTATSAARQWRIHFHVPLFTAEYDGLGSTQADVSTVLHEVRRTDVTRHLEIETYTWSVLPQGLKVEIVDSIAREYEWVLGEWKVETENSKLGT
jgi:sugar phosphate isomerase/epimerase